MVNKTIFVMHEEGVSEPIMKVILDGIYEVLKIAGLRKRTKQGLVHRTRVINWGNWQAPEYKIMNVLIPHRSIDWYIEIARDEATKVIDSTKLFFALNPDWVLAEDENVPHRNHHKVVVLKSQLANPQNANLMAYGCATPNLAAILTVNRLNQIKIGYYRESLKTLVMHEIAHLLGLIPVDRIRNIEMSYGKHCTNCCIMRQETRSGSLLRHTVDRLIHGPFCEECESHLRTSFNDK